MKEMIILVDEIDNELGAIEKLEAHKQGVLHRAFSIFIFDSNNKMLIHRRALEKYHTPGLWTNACCSHPRYDEKLEDAVHRRLIEEMGFDCDLKEIFTFIYKAEFDNGLIENELDHVFIGYHDGAVNPNKDEVHEYDWVETDELLKDIEKDPYKYTYWFKEAIVKVIEYLKDSTENKDEDSTNDKINP